MADDTLNDRIIRSRAELKELGVTHVSLFGSRARGTERAESDLDVLIDVDARSRFNLLDLVAVEGLISQSTGLQANVFMRRSLSREFSQSIERDIRTVF